MINKLSKQRLMIFSGKLFMEGIIPHETRRKILAFARGATIVAGLVSLAFIFLDADKLLRDQSLGVFYLLLSLFMIFFSMEAFFASYYGKRESEIIAKKIIYLSGGKILRSFLLSDFGKKVMLRAEISDTITKELLSREAVNAEYEYIEGMGIKDLAIFLFDTETDFRKMLASYGIDKGSFSKILDWTITDFEKEYRREAWWWPEYLAKIPGIAKDWNYGRLFYLIKYGNDMSKEAVSPNIDFDIKEFGNETKILENILSKGRESNAMLVGEPGAGVTDMILEFVRKLNRGKIHPALEHKRVFRLNWNDLTASNKEKADLEAEIIRTLNEAVRAGNIILVIEDLPGFIKSTGALGISLTSILNPYLNSSLQMIVTTDKQKFHGTIAKESDLMRRFDRINIEETDEEKTLEILQNTIRKIEKKSGIQFSYPATKEMVTGATQYFPGVVMPDGAIDILFEILNSPGTRDGYVTRSDVLDFIEMKTKIPLGKLESTEKDKLLNLESILHEKIIGQEEAVSVISNAMRRTRADIRNAKKPIGTFLFLGPTGVGKTETAKALASVFFGDERFMMRLDMTEYQKGDSLPRLIGSFESGKPGVLSAMLRDNPYGVLLLDEFEKSEKDVLNLFLQILDEGFFSDMEGKKVSLRNVIIIATSNAASDYIFQLVRDGKDLEKSKDEIIRKIVDSGTFKPELLNRFDALVIFHPLDKSQLFQIAKLMLGKLRKRLANKGVELVITDELALAIVNEGTNDIFGARPMNRYIQDKIEHFIATKMISGDIISGSKIEIKPEDLN